jgi:hypothetical protein
VLGATESPKLGILVDKASEEVKINGFDEESIAKNPAYKKAIRFSISITIQ